MSVSSEQSLDQEVSSRETIPVIDLATASAEELTAALAEYSCMFVTNHGVTSDLRRRMIDVSVEFFDLPLEERELVAWDGQGVWNGWMPHGGTYHRQKGKVLPNLVEWYMAHELETFDNWPVRPPALRTVWTEYYAVMADLAAQIISKIAEGLDLPSDELSAWTDRHFANLCLNHYPAQIEPPEPGQVRLSPHTDESTITILTAADAPGGLQVRLPKRTGWTPVSFPADAYFIQAGDLLDHWTNREIRANIHRVVNPPRELASTSQRDTVVFFHFPALDTVVAPAASCVAASGGTAKFAPSTAWDHVMKRQESYDVPEDLKASA
jgi:isopenicillin N synthase-like dioxygenase